MWRFLKKLEIELPYDQAIPLLGIHSKETRIERDTCTPMFIAALFIIGRTWKQPRCPSADEWIGKPRYIYTMPKPLTVWITINWKILKEMGIPDHLTCLLRNLGAGQEATVRTGHGTTDWFQIGKGVRQGYILSP